MFGTVASMLFALAVAVFVSHAHHPRHALAGAGSATPAAAAVAAPGIDGDDPSLPPSNEALHAPTPASTEMVPTF
jgi:hypothetical protein